MEALARGGRALTGSFFWSAATACYPDHDGLTIYLPPPRPQPPKAEHPEHTLWSALGIEVSVHRASYSDVTSSLSVEPAAQSDTDKRPISVAEDSDGKRPGSGIVQEEESAPPKANPSKLSAYDGTVKLIRDHAARLDSYNKADRDCKLM